MGTLAQPVGVTLGHEAALEHGFDDVAQGMVDHPVTEGCGADQPTFGFVNGETGIGSRPVTALPQLLL